MQESAGPERNTGRISIGDVGRSFIGASSSDSTPRPEDGKS